MGYSIDLISKLFRFTQDTQAEEVKLTAKYSGAKEAVRFESNIKDRYSPNRVNSDSTGEFAYTRKPQI